MFKFGKEKPKFNKEILRKPDNVASLYENQKGVVRALIAENKLDPQDTALLEERGREIDDLRSKRPTGDPLVARAMQKYIDLASTKTGDFHAGMIEEDKREVA